MIELISRLGSTVFRTSSQAIVRYDETVENSQILELFQAIDTNPNYKYIDIKDIIFYKDEALIRINFICHMKKHIDMNIPISDSRMLIAPGIDFVKLLDPYTELARAYVKWHKHIYKNNVPESLQSWFMSIILGQNE